MAFRFRARLLFLGAYGVVASACGDSVTGPPVVTEPPPQLLAVCNAGYADVFPCDRIDLVSRLTLQEMRPGADTAIATDMWGWTDPQTGKDYVLAARADGLAIVDVSDIFAPRAAAFLPAPDGTASKWRDVKVYSNHAYVVADRSPGHGIQVLDLTRLRGLADFTELEADGRYTRLGSAHNIAINEETGFAYAVGSSGSGETCGGGLHMADLSEPLTPVFAGCYAVDGTGIAGGGYTHDVQCVVYRGPDADYAGRELCVGSNENRIVIVDVTDKADPVTISTAGYPRYGYVHQGVFGKDQRYFYQNDELDERFNLSEQTRLFIWDLSDLDDPVLAHTHMGPTGATDHNLWVRGDVLYQSNYNFGVRVLDISDPVQPVEVGYFDTVPATDDDAFKGAWSSYPFFDSGALPVTSEDEGFFVLRLSTGS